MRTIDLFAGAGGFSTGAAMAGCNLVWAANHWPAAVEWHEKNHPGALHLCQDLHQADWSSVPEFDLMLASPCCHGHSKARGKASGNPQHDASRSTAWAVVSAAEYHRPAGIIVENVPEFMDWTLYEAWVAGMQALGYSLSPHIIDAADYGAPQNRVRLFIVLTRSKAPLHIELEKTQHTPARSFLDFNAGRWSPIDRPGRAAATLERVRAGRAAHGERFIFSYYGNTRTGRSIDRPIGTITTRDRWALVDGDRMRMLSRWEARDAMSFPNSYQLPDNHTVAMHFMGNAVCPEPASRVIRAVAGAL